VENHFSFDILNASASLSAGSRSGVKNPTEQDDGFFAPTKSVGAQNDEQEKVIQMSRIIL
jgi:hypothetical protein